MSTINKWKARYPDFPDPAQVITPTMHLYDPDDLARFLERHPNLGKGRGEWNRKSAPPPPPPPPAPPPRQRRRPFRPPS